MQVSQFQANNNLYPYNIYELKQESYQNLSNVWDCSYFRKVPQKITENFVKPRQDSIILFISLYESMTNEIQPKICDKYTCQLPGKLLPTKSSLLECNEWEIQKYQRVITSVSIILNHILCCFKSKLAMQLEVTHRTHFPNEQYSYISLAVRNTHNYYLSSPVKLNRSVFVNQI